MNNAMIFKIETKLCELFNRKHSVLLGSATTGLTILFKALGLSYNQTPLFPATSCLVAFSAARYAETKPEFIDINLSDYTLNGQQLKNVLQNNSQIRAIVPTHLYGHLYDIETIHQIAHEFGVFVIEDAAQAVGASHNGFLAGSFGDASVISFGHTKILEIGHGGAILTDDDDLYAALISLRNNLSVCKNIDFNDYRQGYYNIINTDDAWYGKKLLNLQDRYKDGFVHSFNDNYASILLDKLTIESIEDARNERNYKWHLYNKYLESPYILKPAWRKGSVAWRYSFLCNQLYRDRLLIKLRNLGIHCSSWYPNFSRLFSDDLFHNSLTLEKSVINLWVDETYDQGQIIYVCEQINRILGEISIE